MTGDPGSLVPTTPSLEPNWSTTGASKAAVTRSRAPAGKCSLLLVTASGAICSRPAA